MSGCSYILVWGCPDAISEGYFRSLVDRHTCTYYARMLEYLLPELLFGPSKSKQRPMLLDEQGSPKVISISGCIRKMSDETQRVFDALF